MRTITKEELVTILEKHKLWWFGKIGGERANLCGADLRGADLCGAHLCGAHLCGADLCCADLCDAHLCDADLRGADLCDADLRGADLCDADLCGADLRGADLCDAHLCGAHLCGAELRGAKNLDKLYCDMYTAFYPLQCPESGSFVGYKKANNLIVKLEICENALRSSATSRKCRCSKAKVLEIQNEDGTSADVIEVRSDHDSDFIYKIGETVSVDNFDTNRWNECAPGIHFFLTRDEAVKYS